MNFLTGEREADFPEVRIDSFKHSSMTSVVDSAQVPPGARLYPSGPRNEAQQPVSFLRITEETLTEVLQLSMYALKTRATEVA